MQSLPISESKLLEIIFHHGFSGAIFVVDTGANILYANDHAETIVRIPKQNLVDQNFWKVVKLELMDGKALALYDHPITQAFRNKINQTTPFFCRILGEKEPLVLKVITLFEDEQIKGAVINLRTASRTLELSEMKTLFTSFAAHQLKTPSGAVKGFLELLLRQGSNAFSASQWENLASAYYANERLIEVSRHLLDLTRLEGGLIQTKPESFLPAEVLQNKRAQYNLLAQSKKINIRISPWESANITTDKYLYTEMVDVILSNALRFAPENSLVVLSVVKKDQHFITSVEDNGPGLNKEQQERLFLGVEAEASVHHGLGLRLAHKYANLLRGRISWQPNPAGGSIFSINLPDMSAKF